jgi:hypothetical protein
MIPDEFSYSIPYLTLRFPLEESSHKFIIGNKSLEAKATAKEYLRGKGWWVTAGDDGILFFSVLSANFRQSYFAEVCKNYIGPNATELLNNLDLMCVSSLSSGHVSTDHLQAAADFLCRYYSGVNDQRNMRKIADFCATLPTDQVLGLIKMHRSLRYFTRGIPTLFAARSKAFLFVEVKTETGTLRSEQYIFIEALAREVKNGLLVLRILPLNGGGADQLRNPADAALN